jgi:hypothetical protein
MTRSLIICKRSFSRLISGINYVGFSRYNKRVQMEGICNTLRQYQRTESHESFTQVTRSEYHFRNGVSFGWWTKF